MKAFDLSKCPVVDGYRRCQTREGRAVRIVASDCIGMHPIVGLTAFPEEDRERVFVWDLEGKVVERCSLQFDLINLPEPERVFKGWANFCEAFTAPGIWDSREKADRGADDSRIACVPFEIKFHPGDGLEDK